MPRLIRREHGKGHSYRIDGAKAIGVTTALNALAKPALIDWAARITTAYAVDNWEALTAKPPSERINEIGAARWNSQKEAAERGTRIHALGEKLAHGVEVDVPDLLRGPVEAYARFLDEWKFETEATEAPCCNVKYQYAGTLDSVGVLGLTGERVLLDLKTGKGVYDETALQLAAYRYCDLWQPSGPDSETDQPPVDAVYVAHILPDAVRLLPVEAGPDQWRIFLYALYISRHMAALKDEPLIGSAIHPEEIGA
jgi:hypothetical protein